MSNPTGNDWQPPAGEFLLDDLFRNPELAPQAGDTVTLNPPQANQPEYFLKTGTTSYKTLEEAVRGTEEKDRTVERLKQELANLKSQQPTQPQTTTPSAEDYRKSTFKRLAEAANKGDEIAYMDTLAEFQTQILSQFAPALTSVYEQQAISAVESEVKDFRSWLSGPEFSRTMEQFPALAQAIQVAKSDPRAAHQLNEFYKLAYRAYAGDPVRINEIQTQIARTSVAPAVQSRPTVSAGTPTPNTNGAPALRGTYTREQVLSDRNARAQFLKEYRERNSQAMDTAFGDIGL